MEPSEEPEEGCPEAAGQQHADQSEKQGDQFQSPTVPEDMDQSVDPVTETVITETKSNTHFSKSVKLRAFNIFALNSRPSIKDEFESLSGLEVKRIVGSKWANTAEQDKTEYFEKAQREHNEMVAKGLIDPNATQGKPRKNKSDMEAVVTPGDQPVKRKRGRPRKSETLAMQGGETGGDGFSAQTSDAKAKRQKKIKTEVPAPPMVDGSLIGQQVNGILDGSFDAGYLLSVRVGNSDIVLRGLVFGPGLAVPVSRANDVAPAILQVKRDDTISVPLPAPVVSAVSPAVMCTSMTRDSVAIPGTDILPNSLPPPPLAPVSAGLQAVPDSSQLPDIPQSGFSTVPHSSTHASYSAETVHQHVDVESGA